MATNKYSGNRLSKIPRELREKILIEAPLSAIFELYREPEYKKYLNEKLFYKRAKEKYDVTEEDFDSIVEKNNKQDQYGIMRYIIVIINFGDTSEEMDELKDYIKKRLKKRAEDEYKKPKYMSIADNDKNKHYCEVRARGDLENFSDEWNSIVSTLIKYTNYSEGLLLVINLLEDYDINIIDSLIVENAGKIYNRLRETNDIIGLMIDILVEEFSQKKLLILITFYDQILEY